MNTITIRSIRYETPVKINQAESKNYKVSLVSTNMDSKVELLENIQFTEGLEDIGLGRNELVLKCIDGIFKGTFIYVTTSVTFNQNEGETFGCGDPNKHPVTIYIERAGLSDLHSQIIYDRDSDTYLLRDLNSDTGTWIKVAQTFLPGEPLCEGTRIKIGDYEFETMLGAQLNYMDHWIRRHNLQPWKDYLEEVETFQDLQSLRIERFPADFRRQLQVAKAEAMMLKENLQSFILYHPEKSFEVKWDSVVIGSSYDCDVMIEGVEPRQAEIRLLDNWHILQNTSERGPIYRKLENEEWFPLLPGSIFKIGTLEFEACRFNVGRAAEKGVRETMEDNDVVKQNLFIYEEVPVSFFAVYDGHGGNQCSNFLKENLHLILRETWLAHPQKDTNVLRAVSDSLRETFHICDEQFRKQHEDICGSVGSAAIVCVIIGDRVICANLGDSRAVLSRQGRPIPISVDHKPSSAVEARRIQANGGYVANGRVYGRLAVSRAIGDFDYKGNGKSGGMVSNDPDIRQIFLSSSEDEFLLIACDGFFDAYQDEEAVSLTRDKLKKMQLTEQDPQRVIREIVNSAIFNRKTTDNVTALLVTLNCGIRDQLII